MGTSNVTAHDLNNEMRNAVLPVTIIIGTEAVIGFFGNIFIIVVYSTRYPLCNFRYFVLAMAVVDLTSCLTIIPGEIFSQLNWYDYKLDWVCRTKSFFNVFTAWASGLILACLAFDRYRKICWPLSWQVSKSCVRKLLVITVIFASLVSIPITVLWGKQTYVYNHNGLKINVSICEKSSQYKDTISPFIYVTGVYIIPIGMMMFSVCVLNFLTARTLFCKMGVLTGTLRNSQKNVDMKNSQHRQENRSDVSGAINHNSKNNEHGFSLNGLFSRSPVFRGLHAVSTTPARFMGIRYLHNNESSNGNSGRTSPISIIRREFERFDSIIEVSGVNSSRPTLPGAGPIPRQASQCDLDEVGLRHQRDSSSREQASKRVQRKTLIMLILTSAFVVTMVMYVVLLSVVSSSENVLQELSNSGKVVFFFFWRLYFINCLINPILYGFMDYRFRNGLVSLFRHRAR